MARERWGADLQSISEKLEAEEGLKRGYPVRYMTYLAEVIWAAVKRNSRVWSNMEMTSMSFNCPFDCSYVKIFNFAILLLRTRSTVGRNRGGEAYKHSTGRPVARGLSWRHHLNVDSTVLSRYFNSS
jgi:hypothetical protein